MEMFCFGLMGGMILAVIFIAGGALYARNTEKSNDVDSDIRVYVPCRDRDRSGYQRDNPQMDEEREIIKYKDGKITNEYSKVVLEIMLIMMKNTLSTTEKDAIQCAINVLDCSSTTLDF